MGRKFKVSSEAVAVSAAQDLLQVKGATGKMLRILQVTVGCTNTTLPPSQQISLRCRTLPTVVTDGSGGTTPTPQKVDPGDAAASFTALANSTTKATTTGTAITQMERGEHLYAGLDYTFPEPPLIGPLQSFVFELLSTVNGTVNLSSESLVEEMGG